MTTAFLRSTYGNGYKDISERLHVDESEYKNLQKEMVNQGDEFPIILSMQYTVSTQELIIKKRFRR